MYGLFHKYHHFSSFDQVKSLPNILNTKYFTGLIGKKHVGPETNFAFDFEHSEQTESIMQVGRNITRIHELTKLFFDKFQVSKKKYWFLYVAFHDPHRCGHTHPEFGAFCESFGNEVTMPGYKPQYFDSDKVVLPDFIPKTEINRIEIAKQWTAISRLDQGIGLVTGEVEKRFNELGKNSEILAIFTSDNGDPFPDGRTNLYRGGLNVPFVMTKFSKEIKFSPELDATPVSHFDIVPTILNFVNISTHLPKIFGRKTTFSGTSLITKRGSKKRCIFSTHSFHEISMPYAMRSIQCGRYKLIWNMHHSMKFPIDQDFFISDSFQEIMNRTKHGEQLKWTKTYKQYRERSEFEGFIVRRNREIPVELDGAVRGLLWRRLMAWLEKTNDPFRCGVNAVLQDSGNYKNNPVCLKLI